MEITKIICDKCGKEIGSYYISHVNLCLRYWHGGSIGGEEDEDKYSFDLCDDCSRQLSYKIKDWLKAKKKQEAE